MSLPKDLHGAVETPHTRPAHEIMYPYMYPQLANLSGGLEFTGTLQSPSGTKIEKGLAKARPFFFGLL